jgi:H+-transporting ATPase
MKATVIKHLRERRLSKTQAGEVPALERMSSRVGSIHESLYSNRTNFLRRTMRKVGFGGRVSMKPEELKRFSTLQAQSAGETLASHPSPTTMAAQSAPVLPMVV